MKAIMVGTAMLALAATTAGAQDLTPFQRQVLGGIKKTLTEYVQKSHANCDATSKEVCDIERMDVLDNVLKDWENTPDYGKYAVTMMDWQGNLATTVGEMARQYKVRRGHLDIGFENELHRRMRADPIFTPPEEYFCRHTFGTPHLYGSQGACK